MTSLRPNAATASVIVTLTLNPALDLSTSVDTIEPSHKLRCDDAVVHPGGGGVNVSRVIRELGGETLAIVALGGHVGSLVHDELRRRGVPTRRVAVRHPTRQNYAVTERSTGRQYRFVHAGGPMSSREWDRCVDATLSAAAHATAVVLSSSLPPGLPDDSLAVLAERLRPLAIPIIVDASGPALCVAARAPVDLVKPSMNELQEAVGRELSGEEQFEDAARELLADGDCATIAVSLGPSGALFVPRNAASFVVRAPEVEPISTIGAGDSMVAGVALTLARGGTLHEAAKLGVAAGSAAVLAHGTGLCRRADVERLLDDVRLYERSTNAATD